MRLFKVLTHDGHSCNGGDAEWFLPKGKRPGKWMPAIEGELTPCANGYHLCREQDLIHWLGEAIWEAEHGGEIVTDDNKVVVRKARLIRRCEHWNERNARLFACWCAEGVLHLYEDKYPNDSRVRDCIETTRAVANGHLPISELAAARGAAWAAGRAAAWDAAWDAAWAAGRTAAGAAGRGAAWDAGRAAARGAARGAAWDAAWAAGRGAARGAAWDAAWAAGRGAARDAQTTTLMHLLETGDLPPVERLS